MKIETDDEFIAAANMVNMHLHALLGCTSSRSVGTLLIAAIAAASSLGLTEDDMHKALVSMYAVAKELKLQTKAGATITPIGADVPPAATLDKSKLS